MGDQSRARCETDQKTFTTTRARNACRAGHDGSVRAAERRAGVAVLATMLLAVTAAPASAHARPDPFKPSPYLASFDVANGHESWRSTSSRVGRRYVLFEGHGLVYAEETSKAWCEQEDPAGPGWLIAFDARTGDERWRAAVAATGSSSASIGIAHGIVVARGRDQSLQGLDATTGERHWSTPLDGFHRVDGTPSSVLVTDGTTLKALDRRTGKIQWTYSSDGQFGSILDVIVATDDTAVVIGNGTRGVDLHDGHQLWDVRIDQRIFFPSPHSPLLIALTPSPGNAGPITAYDVRTLQQVWSVPQQPSGTFDLASPAGYVDGLMLFNISGSSGPQGTTQPRIRALDANTGELRWERNGGVSTVGSHRGLAIASGPAGTFAFETASGKTRWQAPTPDGLSRFVVGTRLFVSGGCRGYPD